MPHNIGRTWNSPYGVQTIVRHDPHPSGALYAVETAESGAIRLYPVARIEEVIKADEYRTTQAYQDELREREELARLRAEARIKREAEEARILAEIARFTHEMTPVRAGKVRDALLMTVRNNGNITTRKAMVEKMVAEGRKVGTWRGMRTLESADGSFMDEKTLTKTAMDYAEWLIANRES